MTWNEFKEEVERQMEEQGLTGEEEIWYIDIGMDNGIDDVEDIEVAYNPSWSLMI